MTKKPLSPEMAAKVRDLIIWTADQPGLVSLLYDLGLTPECIEQRSPQWFDMVNIMTHWQAEFGRLEEAREALRHIALLADSAGRKDDILDAILSKARKALRPHNPPPSPLSPAKSPPRPLGEPASGGQP
jgi:hypothetical protein